MPTTTPSSSTTHHRHTIDREWDSLPVRPGGSSSCSVLVGAVAPYCWFTLVEVAEAQPFNSAAAIAVVHACCIRHCHERLLLSLLFDIDFCNHSVTAQHRRLSLWAMRWLPAGCSEDARGTAEIVLPAELWGSSSSSTISPEPTESPTVLSTL